jgi:hypothetical protein
VAGMARSVSALSRHRPEKGSPNPRPPTAVGAFIKKRRGAIALPPSAELGEALLKKGSLVFTPEQYRAKAAEYAELGKRGNAPNEVREFQKLEQSLTMLADNEQWLVDNHDKLANNLNELTHEPEQSLASEAALAVEEEHVLRCLGAALIMQWNTLPTKLQRELFDNAGSMGELLDTADLRGQIARFLRKRTNGEDET